jgi:hypothetical protein
METQEEQQQPQMEYYECPCGSRIKGSYSQLGLHFKTKRHNEFLKNGTIYTPKLDPSYPVGHYRRHLPARKEAMKRYSKKMRDEIRKDIAELRELLAQKNAVADPTV